MKRPLRVLLVEDMEDDALLVLRTLITGGFQPEHQIVDTPAGMKSALDAGPWDIVISDFSMPKLSGLDALALLRKSGLDTPFILVSGTFGEEEAVRCLHAGATDYLLKERLHRLPSAVKRALDEVEDHRQLRRAEDSLKVSEQRSRAILDSALDAIVTMDAEGRIVEFNPAAERMFGYARNKVIGETMADLIIPPAFRERHRRALTHFSPDSKSSILGRQIEILALRRDGSEFPVELFIQRIALGGSALFTGFIRDITVRKQAEAALKLSEFSVQNASLPTFWISREARILRVNLAACDLLGCSEAELLAKAFTEFDPDLTGERWPARWQESRERRKMSFETRLRHTNGSTIPVEIDLNWFEFDGLEYYFAFVRDLTERRKQERAALRSQRMESIGSLAGGIAHDLNNALAPVLMTGELLRAQYPKEPELLDMAMASVKRAAGMVRHLLTFAKGADGERLTVQPRTLVRDLQKLINGSFPKNIELVIKCNATLPTVVGDATQLHQVLLNLCVNARDAMPQGGTLTLEAETVEMDATQASFVAGAKPGKYLALRVRDTGTGIQPEIVDRIFEPFFTTKDAGTGTGLGLSTCVGIVKGHGGFLQVYSHPGEGSAFTVYLPRGRAGGDTEIISRMAEKYSGQGQLILFVDDEPSVRDAARAVLQRLNFIPVMADGGADGLVQAALHRSDIRAIITDLHMPGTDGLAFMREVRRILPEIPIIVASGRLEDDVAGELKSLGMTGRLDKPFTETALAEALRKLLTPR